MRRFNRLAAVGAAVLNLTPSYALAQFGDGLTSTAIAVIAFERSADRCAYEPIVGQAINRLRDHYAETEPYQWQRALRENKDANDILGNMTALALQGSPYTADPRVSGPPKPAPPRDNRCISSGLAVGAALPFAGPLIGFDPILFGEANRLMEGKGRPRQSSSNSPEAPTTSVPPSAAMNAHPPYVGRWAPRRPDCTAPEQDSVIRFEQDAEISLEYRCDLKVREQSAATWNVESSCSEGDDKWTMNSRIQVDGDRLVLYNEGQAPADFVRCD
ncbi:hypothetical protein MKK75_19650 [Methylobacterium sp. J-030]|uniref:hypothetical protein n=1 Tax=Methylobacterium sp. J-030 TaxID=2836627 RepID=UPI001FBB654E|nr:hypothetical protein [Methylobacterium sp. J-030]MCJ2070976.1 hypothetical protein [Methylobacterium sp. J-030]